MWRIRTVILPCASRPCSVWSSTFMKSSAVCGPTRTAVDPTCTSAREFVLDPKPNAGGDDPVGARRHPIVNAHRPERYSAVDQIEPPDARRGSAIHVLERRGPLPLLPGSANEIACPLLSTFFRADTFGKSTTITRTFVVASDQSVSGRPGGCPSRPPTDPDVQISRIRLFGIMDSPRDLRPPHQKKQGRP